MARLAQQDVAGWLGGLRAALAADSSFVPAVLDLFDQRGRLHPSATAILVDIARNPAHPLSVCAAAVVDGMEHQMPVQIKLGKAGVPACGRLAQVVDGGSRLSASERADLWASVQRDAPESALATANALGEMANARQWEQVASIAGVLTESPIDVLRVHGRGYLALAMHWRGRHAEAIALERRDGEEIASESEAVRAISTDVSSNHTHLRDDTVGSSIKSHLDSVARVAAEWNASRPLPHDPWQRLQRRLHSARMLLDQGDLTGSLSESQAAVRLADSVGDPGGLTMAYTLRGRAAVKAGESDLAERSLLDARKYAALWGSGELEYEVEHNLLHLYEGLGRWDDARQAGLHFVAATGRAHLTPVRMMSHRDMGWFLRRRGEWEAAQHHFDAMVATVDSLSLVDEYPFYAGEYYESIGDLERARSYYAKVTNRTAYPRVLEALVRLSEATGDTAAAVAKATELEGIIAGQYPEYRALLPGVLARAGRHVEAIAGFERARSLAATRGNVAGWARLTTELARVDYDRGDLARAAVLGDSAFTAATHVADHEFAIRAAAIAASARGQRARLAALQRQATRMRNTALQLEVMLLEGRAERAAGNDVAALATFQAAQGLADSLGASLELDPSRAGFRAAQLEPSSRALALAIDRRNDSRAIRWWMEWSGLRKGRELHTPGRSQFRVPNVELPPNAVLVDYAVVDSLVAALVMTRTSARIEVLPISPAAVRTALSSLYGGVAPRVGSSVDQHRARVNNRAMTQLGEGLIAPLISRIDELRNLIVVPDGPLHLVPFDALPLTDGEGASAELLLDRHVVHLAPTLAAARSASGTLGFGRIVVVDGSSASSPVPGAEREVAGIQKAASGLQVTLMSGSQATEERVRAETRGASILHFTAHARPNHHNPDMSDVLLRPGKVHDGRLQAHEIRTMPLSDALVVLSACETAGGRVVAGEGPLSLSRAFLQAGAGQVVATLWPVGEDAADLMTDFYGALARGRQPAEALHEAKHAARSAGRDPLSWAAFTVMVAR